uniref:Uncharacterized protein n=1 Tax=Tetraodon nigroviridis TaxID=99883 RepID=H3C4R5_TETNG
MTEYSYECEPVSPGDVPVGHSQDLVRVILGIGFVSFTVILMILLGCFCMKKLKGHKSRDTTIDNQAITAKAADFQLSQEESGFALIIQDVSKDNEHVVQLNLEKVWFTNL